MNSTVRTTFTKHRSSGLDIILIIFETKRDYAFLRERFKPYHGYHLLEDI